MHFVKRKIGAFLQLNIKKKFGEITIEVMQGVEQHDYFEVYAYLEECSNDDSFLIYPPLFIQTDSIQDVYKQGKEQLKMWLENHIKLVDEENDEI